MCFSVLPRAPGLPEVAPLMRRYHVQPRGQAEAEPWYEGINETCAGQIQVSVVTQEDAQLMMRLNELVESICKGGGLARANLSWRLHLEGSSCRRFQIGRKPPPDQPRQCRNAPLSS